MKFEIVQKHDEVKKVVLKKGWDKANDYDQYLDLEYTPFSFQRLEDYDVEKGVGDLSYIEMRVTFVRNTACTEFERAYITFLMNVPNGDHKSWDGQINVTVEEAMRICFEENVK